MRQDGVGDPRDAAYREMCDELVNACVAGGEERTMDLEQRIAAALGAADVTSTDLAALMPDEVVVQLRLDRAAERERNGRRSRAQMATGRERAWPPALFLHSVLSATYLQRRSSLLANEPDNT